MVETTIEDQPQGNGDLSSLSTEEIAEQWRAQAHLNHQWQQAPQQAGMIGGHGTGIWAYCSEARQRRVYLKPRRKINTTSAARAAREKIASDLAAEVD